MDWLFVASAFIGLCIARWIVVEVFLREAKRKIEFLQTDLSNAEDVLSIVTKRHERVVSTVIRNESDKVKKEELYQLILNAEAEPTGSQMHYVIEDPNLQDIIHENPNLSDKL